jgi:hypothetical protein
MLGALASDLEGNGALALCKREGAGLDLRIAEEDAELSSVIEAW